MGEKNGREGEAERLVDEHYADVLRYCRRHAPAGLAEDAAQEAADNCPVSAIVVE